MVAATPTALALCTATGEATPDSMSAAIQEFTGGKQVKIGRVTLDLPPLVENGNAVPMTVSVESPMKPDDFVSAIAVFNEKNPQPHIATFHLTAAMGKARIGTRVRLADSQTVIAIAKMNDGSLFSGTMDVIVTLAACTEGL